jgi:Tat protein secretion system quality control protein TatD with DNase activity
MSKGYQVMEIEILDKLLKTFERDEFVVSILYWLIGQVKIELGSQTEGIQIEVIRLLHHTPNNAYPAIGIHYENPSDTRDIAPLIETIMVRTLQERSVLNLLLFIGESGIDWKAVTTKIMNNNE